MQELIKKLNIISVKLASNSDKNLCLSEKSHKIEKDKSVCNCPYKIFDFDSCFETENLNSKFSSADALLLFNNDLYFFEFKFIPVYIYCDFDIQEILFNFNVYDKNRKKFFISSSQIKDINKKVNNYYNKKSIFDDLKLKAIESYNFIYYRCKCNDIKFHFRIVISDQDYLYVLQKHSEGNKNPIEESLSRLLKNNEFNYYYDDIKVMSSQEFIDFYDKQKNSIYSSQPCLK